MDLQIYISAQKKNWNKDLKWWVWIFWH